MKLFTSFFYEYMMTTIYLYIIGRYIPFLSNDKTFIGKLIEIYRNHSDRGDGPIPYDA